MLSGAERHQHFLCWTGIGRVPRRRQVNTRSTNHKKPSKLHLQRNGLTRSNRQAKTTTNLGWRKQTKRAKRTLCSVTTRSLPHAAPIYRSLKLRHTFPRLSLTAPSTLKAQKSTTTKRQQISSPIVLNRRRKLQQSTRRSLSAPSLTLRLPLRQRTKTLRARI